MQRSFTIISVLLLLFCLLVSAGCNKLRARDELNKGVRAYRAAQFDTAIEHFKRAIENDPGLINARVYLATAYATQFVPGHPSAENKRIGQTAIRAFENVLEYDPNNIISLSYIAQLYFGMAGAEKSLEAMRPLFEKSKEFRRRLVEIEPQNPEHYYSIGVIDWSLTYRPRQELRSKLRLIDPEQPLPPAERRQLRAQNGALVEEGIDVLLKAMDLRANYIDAMAYLNLMYREKADLMDSAIERERLLQIADSLVDRIQKIRQQEAEAPAPATTTQ
ncbi:MAG: hypothetical protein HXY18_20125 [Bryobacteraceae bacterium]|nr:hypothetical protein [Bryobacteraceae bacterium]